MADIPAQVRAAGDGDGGQVGRWWCVGGGQWVVGRGEPPARFSRRPHTTL